jgi:hypothetical protein
MIRPEGSGAFVKRLFLGLIFSTLLFEGTAMAVEEPPYTVSLKDGDFEVREYPALVAAEVTVDGDLDQASNRGFRLLAAYIFGGNTRSQSIAMTAPVVVAPTAGEKIAMTAPVVATPSGSGWVVQFIMPQNYNLETLPRPKDSRVQLKALPPQRVAVIRFSGLVYSGDFARRTAELQEFIAAHHLHAAGPALLARYNPPWTLWFLRRNEVMIPVQTENPG